jgi:PBSX family phage terminase large subunit
MTEQSVVRYEPRGAAARLFDTRDTEVLMDGPAGTGKTLACLYRVHLACLSHANVRALIMRKTGVSLGSTTLATFEETVIPEAIKSGLVQWYGGSPRVPPQYNYPRDSKIVVAGMDKPEKVLSSEYDLIFVDEATELTVTDWETLLTRLRHGKLPWQQAIAACNPAYPSHWLNQRAAAGTMTRLISRHIDNPAFTNTDGSLTPAGAEYFEKLEKLTGVRRDRLYVGRWVAAEGVVYEDWDEAVHVIDRFEIPPWWRRYWAVDFGFTHPFVLQCWAEDGDGRLYLYREIFHTQRLVEDHARQIMEIVTEPVPDMDQKPMESIPDAVLAGRRRWTEPRPYRVVCDHDAEGRATLERHLGISTTKALKTVSTGIQTAQVRMRRAGDGRPRVFVLRDSVVERDPSLVDAKRPASTQEEIPGYVWAIKPGGQLKEEPVKDMDDGCDAMRYMVMEKDGGAKYRIRVMG